MPLKILVAPDKFKGTMTASEAAEAIAEGWAQGRPDDDVQLLPVTDGGDGFGEVMSTLWSAKERKMQSVDAAHRRIRARWWWEGKERTAIIESASVIGLAQLPANRFHPFALDTFGLGALIKAAARHGARTCLIGIGGSATNDGGFGVARALGWRFLDRTGRRIEKWTGLENLTRVIAPARRRLFQKATVAVDVQNALLGPKGATRVYGPQKGLRPGDFGRAERCLRRLAKVVKADLGFELENAPGAGAAGGLGFGLAAFLGTRLEPGFDLFAREARLERELRQADLILTGEGRLDASTMMGKGVGEIAKLCKGLKRRCIGLGGEVVPDRALQLFSGTAAMTQFTTPKAAKAHPAVWLARVAETIARNLRVTS